MKLSVKFGLVVLLVLIMALGGSYVLFLENQRGYRHLQQQQIQLQEDALEREVKQRASTVASFGEACRDYTQHKLAPAVARHLPEAMIFEAQSRTFVARGTFELFRQKPGMKEYSFREASVNPLNPKNRADAEEVKLIERFAADRGLKELSGFYQPQGTELFYVARPIVVESSCLQCHDTPQRAPREVRERYGETHGFGWKEGEVNSILMVTVPAEDLRMEAARFRQQAEELQAEETAAMRKVLLLLLLLAGLLPLLLYGLFEILVHRRIAAAAAVMAQVADDPAAPTRLRDEQHDEIGVMAQAFNHMADSLRDSHLTLEHRVSERTAALEAEVAERKKAEEELHRAKEAAEAASRAKSAFLATVSHEIRTPMNAVLGMASLLANTPLPPEQCEYVRIIRSSGDALLGLINDILDFSKIEAGQLHLDCQPFVIRDCVTATLDLLGVRAREKHLDLTATVAPDVPAVLVGDAARVRQVLINLVGNAVKFTEKGSVALTVTSQKRGDGRHELHVAVRDTGPGIPADRLDRLFQSFSQVDSSPARRHGGTGLGLAICRRLSEMMGGTTGVESTVGQGSRFHFTFVAAEAPAPAKVPPCPDKPEFDSTLGERLPLRILLAEDALINQKLMVAILGRLGYRPKVAANGRQVLEALQRQSYDIILMDVQMPEMDGLQATRHIRQTYADGQRPRIIALTANALKEDRDVCLAAGMDDYLSKPVDIGKLQTALQRWGRHGAEPPPGPASAAVERPPAGDADMDEAVLAELRQLQNEGRPTLIHDLLATFRGDAPQHLAAMRSAAAEGDSPRLRTSAHCLKGAAASLGARRLAALCLELEQKGQAGNVANVVPLLAEVEQHLAQACAALAAEAR